ncbi:MAG: hypothetical protein WD992_01515 [Candidatus Levyibacteriota bacterium]
MVIQEVDRHGISTEELRDLMGGFLPNLVNQQVQEYKALGLDGVALYTGEQLVEWYRGSNIFLELYKKAFREFLQPRTEQELDELQWRLVGGAFEGLAFAYLSKQTERDNIVFSPDRTSQLWHELYPNASSMENSFSSASLFGISVPDGVAVRLVGDEYKITTVYEYKSGINGTRGLDRSITEFRKAQERFPHLFDSPRLEVVSLEGSQLPSPVENRPEVGLMSLPFNNLEYHFFVEYLFDSRPEKI